MDMIPYLYNNVMNKLFYKNKSSDKNVATNQFNTISWYTFTTHIHLGVVHDEYNNYYNCSE